MPTAVPRVLFLASLLLVACTVSDAQQDSATQPGRQPPPNEARKVSSTAPLQGATAGSRNGVVIGTRSAEPSARQRNAQQDETLVAAIASAQVSATPEGTLGGPVSVGFGGGSAAGGTQARTFEASSSARFGSTGVITEAIPTETRPVRVDVSKKLGTAIQNSDIAGAVELLTREDDVHELARGLKFDGSNRQGLLKKSPSRMPDGDVITMKSIAKAVLDTKDARKFAMVMVLSTLNERREDLERRLTQILRDRELMHAILFADPAKQFIPDELRVLSSAPWIRQSEKDGASNSNLLNGLGRRRLTCEGCSPQNSFVCAHCWPKDLCIFDWCRD